jgi:hypothetical protein
MLAPPELGQCRTGRPASFYDAADGGAFHENWGTSRLFSPKPSGAKPNLIIARIKSGSRPEQL